MFPCCVTQKWDKGLYVQILKCPVRVSNRVRILVTVISICGDVKTGDLIFETYFGDKTVLFKIRDSNPESGHRIFEEFEKKKSNFEHDSQTLAQFTKSVAIDTHHEPHDAALVVALKSANS